MRKTRQFDDKKKANFFFNYLAKVSTEANMCFDVPTGKYIVTWKWDKNAFNK